MTMKTIYGNILDQTQGIIVHGVNAQGLMGAGLAKEVKEKYPFVFDEYKQKCKSVNNQLSLLGDIQAINITKDLIIVNAFTQRFYGRSHQWGDENYRAVEKVFIKVNELAFNTNMSISYPMIGAGLGGGDFVIISEIINKVVSPYIQKTLFILPNSRQHSNCAFC